MRRYEGMRLPPGIDRALRKELLKPDRWLKQAQAALAKSLTKTNSPLAIVTTGSGGTPGNLPEHTHSSATQGGTTFGTATSTITGNGQFNLNKVSIGTTDTTGRLNILEANANELALRNVSSFTTATAGTPSNQVLFQRTLSDAVNGINPHDQIQLKEVITTGFGGVSNILNVAMDYTADAAGAGTEGAQGLSFTIQGLGGNAINSISGLAGISQASGTAAVTSISGIKGDVRKAIGAGGTITNADAITGTGRITSAGTITTMSLFRAVAPTVITGTITNLRGLWLPALTQGASTNYAIYSEGGISYHAGKFGINNTGAAAMVDVISSSSSTVGMTIKTAAAASANAFEVKDSTGALKWWINTGSGFDANGTFGTSCLYQFGGTGGYMVHDADSTVKLAWNLTNIPTATTNTATWQRGNGTIVGTQGTIDLTAQTSSIGTTNVMNTQAAGMFLVSVYAMCTTAGTAGTLDVTIGWTDTVGATTEMYVTGLSLSATGRGKGNRCIYCTVGTAITYSTTVTGALGSPQYELRIRATALS